MSISSTTRKVGPSACNGVVTAFPFTFKVFQASDLLVVLTNASNVESTLTLTTDYTVSLNANQDSNPGGTITTNTAYATGNAITIGSYIPQTQTVTLTNNGGFYPTVLNDFFDKIVILVQQMSEKLNRSFSLPFSASSSISTSLPLPSAGKALKWAADGLSLINSSNDPDASATAAASSAASAATSAASALSSLQTFQGTYYGSATSDPTLDPLGNAPTAGDLYFNTSTSKLRIYSGTAWQDSATASPSSFSSNIFNGNASTTAFTLSAAPADPSSVLVSIGGVWQRPTTDYTVSGTTLTFTSAPPTGTANILALVATTVAVGTPTDGSVSTAKLQNGSVTAAKIAAGAIEGAVVTAFSHRNKIENGGFDVWQQSTTYALTNSITYGSADQWCFWQGGASASAIANQVAAGLTGFRYAVKLGRNSGSALTGALNMLQALVTANSVPLAGQQVTLSFYAKAGANFSAASSQINVLVYSGTGTDQSAASIASWTGVTNPISQAQTITTSWVRYSITGTMPAGCTQVGVQLSYTPTGTAGADDNLYITGVQLEPGANATPFEFRPFGMELERCRWYYRQSFPYGTYTPATTAGADTDVWVNAADFYDFGGKTLRGGPMRTTPTLTIYDAVSGTSGNVRNLSGSANVAVSVSYQSDSSYRVNTSAGTASSAAAWQWIANARL